MFAHSRQIYVSAIGGRSCHLAEDQDYPFTCPGHTVNAARLRRENLCLLTSPSSDLQSCQRRRACCRRSGNCGNSLNWTSKATASMQHTTGGRASSRYKKTRSISVVKPFKQIVVSLENLHDFLEVRYRVITSQNTISTLSNILTLISRICSITLSGLILSLWLSKFLNCLIMVYARALDTSARSR